MVIWYHPVRDGSGIRCMDCHEQVPEKKIKRRRVSRRRSGEAFELVCRSCWVWSRLARLWSAVFNQRPSNHQW